jgi:hypothetical protein
MDGRRILTAVNGHKWFLPGKPGIVPGGFHGAGQYKPANFMAKCAA